MLQRRIVCCVALCAIYMQLPNARPDLRDTINSEYYLALSYALTHGLGYTRSLVAGMYVPHTTWPPGFPLLLAPVTVLDGLPLPWLAIKIYLIGLGLAGVALAWLYVKRVTNSIVTADLAALFLALLPTYWLFSRMAMTECPSIGFILFALLLIDMVWARRRPRAMSVAAVALVSGLGMLLRGTNLCLLLAPLGYLVGERKAVVGPSQRIGLIALHALAFCLPAAMWALRNHSIDRHGLGIVDGFDQFRMFFTVNPLDSASPLLAPRDMLRVVFDNLTGRIIYLIPEQLIPGLWAVDWRDWPHARLMGLLVLLAITLLALPRRTVGAPLRIRIPLHAAGLVITVLALPRRALGLPLMITIAFYGAGLSFYALGWLPRFWIPVTSLLMLLILIQVSPLLDRLHKHLRLLLISALTIVYTVNCVVFALRFDAHPYDGDLGDLVALFDRVGNLQPSPSAVLATHHVLLTLSTGVPAPLTVPERGLEPHYTGLILRHPESLYAPPLPIRQQPLGAALLMSQGAWNYYVLPKPMTLGELSRAAPRDATDR